MRPSLLLIAWLAASTPAAAEPPDPPDADGSGSETPEGSDAPETTPIPSPAEAARSAPVVTPRPPGVPEGWTEIPLEPEDEDSDELVVWGTAAIRESRAALMAAFEAEGWTRKRRDGNGDVVFRGPQPWMGTARLSDAGLLRFRGRVLSLSRVEQVEGPPDDGMQALDPNYRATAGSTRGGLSGPVSKRKLEPHRQALVEATSDAMERYRAVLAETALRQSLAVIPDRLDAVWSTGQSLSGGPPLESYAERRAAILDYWSTRPDTREGRLALDTIGAWISEVMQNSEHPAAMRELDAAAARRSDGRHPTR